MHTAYTWQKHSGSSPYLLHTYEQVITITENTNAPNMYTTRWNLFIDPSRVKWKKRGWGVLWTRYCGGIPTWESQKSTFSIKIIDFFQLLEATDKSLIKSNIERWSKNLNYNILNIVNQIYISMTIRLIQNDKINPPSSLYVLYRRKIIIVILSSSISPNYLVSVFWEQI